VRGEELCRDHSLDFVFRPDPDAFGLWHATVLDGAKVAFRAEYEP